ncbi:SIR2 family protein [Nevskia soli]|uniref:SIR2 family protein n=1 Tax=Nevskia soli TaxID=418856 RepID=UPI0004A76FC4|nr:SIR2 family protein [Nevskia soli]
MPKLGPINVDDRILDAIRDDRLVVFAGAGVSKGPPASLPDFIELARDIAAGTGNALADKEPIDRFLGRLVHKGVEVHQRAMERLTVPDSRPTALHNDLLRLFRSADHVRLVTTNFDLHFETSAQQVFGKCPDIFRAPALPRGGDFRGLVHVHGVLPYSKEIVLTDADFGRAYLTEGWARRFLVEVFRTHTVLFVGYSHNDVVMNYLARALPAGGVAGRFALTEEDGDWKFLGITPIPFRKGEGADAFKELYDGVHSLAERATRGALDWRSKLAEIGNRTPPADDETIGEIEQALKESHTTRFFVQVARDRGWPVWLNSRKYIEALFDAAPLGEKDRLLVSWLAEHYAIEHPNELFAAVAAQKMRLNPELWWAIGRELGLDDKKELRDLDLTRWVALLLACAPANADHHVLSWLAARCTKQGAILVALEIFLFMGQHRFNVKLGYQWPDIEDEDSTTRLDLDTPLRSEHFSLNEVWTQSLKPHLPAIAQPLLSGVARRLESIHYYLLAWDKAAHDGDALTWGRAAIEPHQQDEHPEPIDALIDAARDALEWLAANQTNLLDAWIERLLVSDVPLLRRLAIYAATARPETSSDDKLNWLLRRIGLYAVAEHHEIHRLAALNYPSASAPVREAIIGAILEHQVPDAEDEKAAIRTARVHFEWLDWLLQSEPTCVLLQAALAPIKAAYPQWVAQDHPDLTHWTGALWVGPQSPWTVDQLLATSPAEQLEQLQNFQGNRFEGPDRDGLLAVLKETCKQRPDWGFLLSDALIARALWTSDLWSPILRGWLEAELTVAQWNTILDLVACPEIQTAHVHEVANLIYGLVKDGGKPFALDVLDKANAIAVNVWNAIERKQDPQDVKDWLLSAINRPAGVIAEFWIHGLSRLLRGKAGADRSLPDDYRRWLTLVALDQSDVGGMGRSVFASQTLFLFSLDEGWTRQHIVPLFGDPNAQRFDQAWDGFLTWGRLSAALAEALKPAFIAALPRLGAVRMDRRRRFIEFIAVLSIFHSDDPTEQILPALFQQGTVADRILFTSKLGFFLRQLDADARSVLWNRWLRRYWENRLQAVPAVLDPTENWKMVEWLPHLGDFYPEAVQLAVRGPRQAIEHSDLFRTLNASELVVRYPRETAQLIVFACNCGFPPYFCGDVTSIIGRLRAAELGQESERELLEAMARTPCGPIA